MKSAGSVAIGNRKILAILIVAVLLPVTFLSVAVWHYSNLIEERAFKVSHEPEVFDLIVTSLGNGNVRLSTTPDTQANGEWKRPGKWGLKSLESYNQVSRVISEANDSVLRQLVILTRPPEVGASVLVDPYAYPANPLLAHGIEYREVRFPAPLGNFHAWLTDGDSETWAILVHGQGSSREQLLRILPTLVESGYPTMTITYRNDRHMPPSPSGYYQFGADEWEDLEAAVTFALSNGAEDVVLVGYSMGGAIVVSFLYNSVVTDTVRGVILDSPALHFDRTVDFNGAQEQVIGVPLPNVLTTSAKALTALRFGIDFSTMNHLDQAGELPTSTPVLLLHGSDDTSVPVSISDDFAEARPDIVEYHVFHGAMHVRLWNHDPERYETVVRDFLTRLE